MSGSTSRRSALIALVLLMLVWGYNWVVMKEVLNYSGPIHFVAWRAALACIVLFAILLVKGESLRPPPIVPTMLIGISQIGLFAILIQMALVSGGAGKTALLTYTMPFWVVILARFALAEHMSSRQWLFIGLAAIGLFCVIEPWAGSTGIGSSVLAITAGLCWAFSVVASKRLFVKQQVSPLSLTAWQMVFGAVALIVVAFFVPEREIDWSPQFIAALAYNAILASGIAWLLWAYIVQRLPATIAGMTSLAVPLCGILFAGIFLGERPSLVESLGIVMIAVALFGITRPARS